MLIRNLLQFFVGFCLIANGVYWALAHSSELATRASCFVLVPLSGSFGSLLPLRVLWAFCFGIVLGPRSVLELAAMSRGRRCGLSCYRQSWLPLF